MDFYKSGSYGIIKGIELTLQFCDIIEADPETNYLFDVLELYLMISRALKIYFKFEGKNCKSLSDDFGDEVFESIRELELHLSIITSPSLLELFSYVLDTIKEELRLFILGLEEIDHIRNADKMRKPFRVEFISYLFRKVLRRKFIGIHH